MNGERVCKSSEPNPGKARGHYGLGEHPLRSLKTRGAGQGETGWSWGECPVGKSRRAQPAAGPHSAGNIATYPSCPFGGEGKEFESSCGPISSPCCLIFTQSRGRGLSGVSVCGSVVALGRGLPAGGLQERRAGLRRSQFSCSPPPWAPLLAAQLGPGRKGKVPASGDTVVTGGRGSPPAEASSSWGCCASS